MRAASSGPRPAPPDAAPPLLEVRAHALGRGVFALRPIAAGTALFGEDEWIDEVERQSFVTLTAARFNAMPPDQRAIFMRFAYNSGTDVITGTFHPEAVRHPTNFTNHCCDPNAGYDGAGAIIALRDIPAGDEIRMDYGTFSFSFDNAFTCGCGAANCRGKVTGNDWPMLVRSGLRLPSFMQKQADSVA